MSAKTFGFDEFRKALGGLEKEFESKSTKLLEETGDDAVAETQLRTPVGVGTPKPGNLRGSIQRTQVENYSVTVGAGREAPYAEYVESGSRTNTPRYMFRDGTKVAEVRFKSESKRLFEDVMKEFKL